MNRPTPKTSYETNPAGMAANEIITRVESLLPKDMGQVLSPRALDEPLQRNIPKRQELVKGLVTHQEVVETPDNWEAALRRERFVQQGDPLESDQTWDVYRIILHDASAAEVSVWRSVDDPSRISYGITDNASLDYDPLAETSALEQASIAISV